MIFNEGYTASAGDELARIDLTGEAIRLTRMLGDTVPDDAEATGLLALMLLTESRRAARTGDDGQLVPLDEQDRTRWNRDLIREGTQLIDDVWSRRATGPYQLQAAIAALHTAAATPERTDWPQIAMLYLWLERLTPTAPVRLSRVVAVAQAYGPTRGWHSSTTSTGATDWIRTLSAGNGTRGARPPVADGRRDGRCGDAVPRGGRPDRQPGRAPLPARRSRSPDLT
ncbi:DUF6596 domain-containing protein [Streptomyces sp. M10(2022)]